MNKYTLKRGQYVAILAGSDLPGRGHTDLVLARFETRYADCCYVEVIPFGTARLFIPVERIRLMWAEGKWQSDPADGLTLDSFKCDVCSGQYGRGVAAEVIDQDAAVWMLCEPCADLAADHSAVEWYDRRHEAPDFSTAGAVS